VRERWCAISPLFVVLCLPGLLGSMVPFFMAGTLKIVYDLLLYKHS